MQHRRNRIISNTRRRKNAMPNITPLEFAKEIKKTAFNNTRRNLIFFLGAGCSHSSGVPLASQLATRWMKSFIISKHPEDEAHWEQKAKELFPNFSIQDSGLYYSEIIAQHLPSMGNRQDEFQNIIRNSFPSYGYYILAQLLTNSEFRNAFGPIITTNFDSLIRQAFENYTTAIPFEVHYESIPTYPSHHSESPEIIKIHGDPFIKPLNTFSETIEYSNKVKQTLESILKNSGIIFIGYNGADNAVCDLFENLNGNIFQYNIYWVGNTLPNNNFGGWLKKNNVRQVNCNDFDFLMFIFQLVFNIPHACDLSDRMKRKYYFSFESTAHAAGEYNCADKENLYNLIAKRYPLATDSYSPIDLLVTSKFHKNLPQRADGKKSINNILTINYCKLSTFLDRWTKKFPYDLDLIIESAIFKCYFFNNYMIKRKAIKDLEKYTNYTNNPVYCRELAIMKSQIIPIGVDIHPDLSRGKFTEAIEQFQHASKVDPKDIKTISTFLSFLTKTEIMYYFRKITLIESLNDTTFSDLINCTVKNCKIILAPIIKKILSEDVITNDDYQFMHNGMFCSRNCDVKLKEDSRHTLFIGFINSMRSAVNLIDQGCSSKSFTSEFCCSTGIFLSTILELLIAITKEPRNNEVKIFLTILEGPVTKTV